MCAKELGTGLRVGAHVPVAFGSLPRDKQAEAVGGSGVQVRGRKAEGQVARNIVSGTVQPKPGPSRSGAMPRSPWRTGAATRPICRRSTTGCRSYRWGSAHTGWPSEAAREPAESTSSPCSSPEALSEVPHSGMPHATPSRSTAGWLPSGMVKTPFT